MKKRKILAAAVAVMAAASMSATDVYAAKADKANDKITFSGSTKTEWKETKEGDGRKTKWKSSVKLNTNVKADERTNVMLGVNYENKDSKTKGDNNGLGEEGMELEFENIWVETKLNDNLWGRFGSQSLGLAKGLTLDADGVLGGKFSWAIDKNNDFQLFVGRDGFSDIETSDENYSTDDLAGRDLSFVNYTHKLDKGSIGTYYMKQDFRFSEDSDLDADDLVNYRQGTQKYWGLYGEYEVAPAVTLGAEWVRNSHTSKKGYIADVEFGKAKKVGEWKHAITYINAPQYLYPSDDYTDFDDLYKGGENGFRGIGLTSTLRLSKASTIEFERYWGDTNRESEKDDDFNTLKVKLAVKF